MFLSCLNFFKTCYDSVQFTKQKKKTDKQTKQNADIGKEIKKTQINLIQIAVTKNIYIKYHLY